MRGPGGSDTEWRGLPEPTLSPLWERGCNALGLIDKDGRRFTRY
jgi:hypothetical protein